MKKSKCIDCNKEISYGAKRCRSCTNKYLHKTGIFNFRGKNNPNFRNSEHCNNHCKDCGKKISFYAERCKSCSHKGSLNLQYVEKIKFNCANCGKEVLDYFNYAKNKEFHFCSCECFKVWSKIGLKKFSGSGNPFFNHKHTQETRKLISEKTKIRLSNPLNHPCYIDGRSGTNVYVNFTKELKLRIRTRDNFQCQCCGTTEEDHKKKYGSVLDVHHINHNTEDSRECNLVSLCKKCHSKTMGKNDLLIVELLLKVRRDMESEFINVKEKHLKEVLELQSRKLVGKVCKRLELFGGSPELAKKDIKELVYESFRETSDLLYTYGLGVEAVRQFNFVKGEAPVTQ